MKKTLTGLISFIIIILNTSAQSTGDYRSTGSGNWNDATKWETFDGNNWIGAATYPGQNPGSGAVTIRIFHEIRLTATVPFPINNLLIDQLNYYPPEGGTVSQNGILIFSSVNPVSLTVPGGVAIHGELLIDDQNGAKSHTLSVGGIFEVGSEFYEDCYYDYTPATVQTINQDDKLGVVFTGSTFITTGPSGLEFQDVTFNGSWFSVIHPVTIVKSATFINGIVQTFAAPSSHNADCQVYYTYNGSISFYDGATVSGASNASFVAGAVWKVGDDPFTFPIGSGNVYAPLTISAPSSAAAIVCAGYARYNAADFGPISDPGLFSISNCEYWSVSSGGIPLDVTVGWSSVSGCGSSPYVINPSEVTLAQFNFSIWRWDSHSGSGVGTSTNGSVTWTGLVPSGPLTLANLSSACNAPWGSATNITSNSANLSWTPVAGATSYDVDYKPYTSSEWINAATATTSTSVALSGLMAWMPYDWRIRTNCSLGSSHYRQWQFQTLCGPPSGLSASNITTTTATLSWTAFPNWVSYNVEYKQSTSAAWIPAATSITYPSVTVSGLTAGATYDWRVIVNCAVGNQGGYTQSSFTTTAPPVVCNDIYEPNNTSNRAKSISLGTTVFAAISSNTDVDWFKVTMPNSSNTILEVMLNNLPADFDLYVYDRNLSLIGLSASVGLTNEAVIHYSRTRKAVYYIKVLGKDGANNIYQCYNLLAQAGGSGSTVAAETNLNRETDQRPMHELLYPNPASEFVQLHFNSTTEGEADVQVLNAAGQLIKHYSIKLNKGYNKSVIIVSDLKPGIYLLRMNRGELSLQRKFVVAR